MTRARDHVDASVRSRRWFRYRLSSVLALITCACACLALVVNRAHVERDAGLAVTRAGGAVVYDYQVDFEELRRCYFFDALPRRRGPPPGPQWLIDAIGEEYFKRIAAVYLRAKVVAPEDLARIAKLRGLKYLNLYRAVVSDDAVAALRDCEGLQELHLGETDIGDASLEPLLALHRLRILRLDRTRVTDSGLRQMHGTLRDGLCDLEYLDLSGCHVTDAGVASLPSRLPPLRVLDLSGTGVSDSGLRRIRKAWPQCVVYEP